jgi:hypothetical protein
LSIRVTQVAPSFYLASARGLEKSDFSSSVDVGEGSHVHAGPLRGPGESLVSTDFQVSTFLIRDLTTSTFDSTFFLDCLPGPLRRSVQLANCFTHCAGPQIQPLRDLSSPRDVPERSSALCETVRMLHRAQGSPGRQSRKDVESKSEFETPV